MSTNPVKAEEHTMANKRKALTSLVSTLIALQIVSFAAVAGLTWYSYSELKQLIAMTSAGGGRPLEPENLKDWSFLVRGHNPAQGPRDAEVVFIEFTDFQCPFCKQFSEGTRRQIVEEFGDRVRFVLKHYPLERIHPQAVTAAIAAQCAHREGRFWEAKEMFFSQPNALEIDDVVRAGDALGLSLDYAECVRNEETKAEIEQDMADAIEVGVPATPTFIVNGRFLVGAQTPTALRSAFADAGLTAD